MGKEEKKKERFDLFGSLFEGKEVIIQSRSGVIYKGKLVKSVPFYVCLQRSTIIGKLNTAKTEFLAIRKDSIEHIHFLEGTEVMPKHLSNNDFQFLQDLVKQGVAEDIDQAIAKCVKLAKKEPAKLKDIE